MIIINLDKPISEKEAWDIIKPACRELYDLSTTIIVGNYIKTTGHKDIVKTSSGIIKT